MLWKTFKKLFKNYSRNLGFSALLETRLRRYFSHKNNSCQPSPPVSNQHWFERCCAVSYLVVPLSCRYSVLLKHITIRRNLSSLNRHRSLINSLSPQSTSPNLKCCVQYSRTTILQHIPYAYTHFDIGIPWIIGVLSVLFRGLSVIYTRRWWVRLSDYKKSLENEVFITNKYEWNMDQELQQLFLLRVRLLEKRQSVAVYMHESAMDGNWTPS